MKRFVSVFILSSILLSLWIYWYSSSNEPEPTPIPTAQTPLHLETIDFNNLPGWPGPSLNDSFTALQGSCALFLKRDPQRQSGTELVPLTIADWQPACKAMQSVDTTNAKAIQAYFEQWFQPQLLVENKAIEGLFTGYYSLNLSGSRNKSKEFSVPLYALPTDLAIMQLQDFDKNLPRKKIIAQVNGNRLSPYATRKMIDKGVIHKKTKVLAWIENRVDRVFLEIQGSGVIHFQDGSNAWLGYAGENGAPYTAIAKVLIDKGVMTRDNASMQGIKRYLKEHPEDLDEVLHANQSFVFFQEQAKPGALGAQGIPLTPGHSLAVDLRYIPMGVPLWLNTRYTSADKQEQPLQRLMIAQDTGGAIRGPVRGDVYWGEDELAGQIAGRMKHPGQYWLLLPKKTEPSFSQLWPIPTRAANNLNYNKHFASI